MDPVDDLACMDVDQLRDALARAEDGLEDVLDERQFVLGQTGMHIGANELARNQKAWAKDEENLRGRIEAIKARLAELQSP